MLLPCFRHLHRVTYAECTLGNHVYYSRFLDMLETARGEFLRQIGSTLLEWQSRDFLFPVIECQLQYQAPARYDDILTIELWPTSAQGIRLNFNYRILQAEGGLVLNAQTFHVCTGLNEKPKRLPDDLISRLRPHLQSVRGPE